MEKLFNALDQYGPIGLLCFILTVATVAIWKVLQKRYEAQDTRIVALETKYENYLKEDHAAMMLAIKASTDAVNKAAAALEASSRK